MSPANKTANTYCVLCARLSGGIYIEIDARADCRLTGFIYHDPQPLYQHTNTEN